MNHGKRPAEALEFTPPPKRSCPGIDASFDPRRAEALALISELETFPDLFDVEATYDDIEFAIPVLPSPKHPSPVKPKPPRKASSTSRPLGLPFTTYNVSGDRAKFMEFVSRWRQVQRYAFSLVYVNRSQYASATESPKKKQTRSKHRSPSAAGTARLMGSELPLEDTTFLTDAQKAIALVVTWDKARCYVVPFSSREGSPSSTSSSVLKRERISLIKEVLEMEKTEKVLFDGKPQLKILLSLGIAVNFGLRDPRIAAWVLEPDTHKDAYLKDLVESYTDSLTALPFDAHSSSSPSPVERAIHASLLQSHQALLVMNALDEELKLNSQYELFTDVEMHLLPILAKMEFYGVGFSSESLLKARHLVESKIRNIEARAYKVARREFDLNSPMEVSYILFEHLKLPYPSLDVTSKVGFGAAIVCSDTTGDAISGSSTATKSSVTLAAAPMRTKRVEKSTKAEVLQAMCRGADPNPLPQLILEHRMLAHTINNYMDPLPHYSFQSKQLHMTRIFSTCHQTCVPTGRLAFDHPNLQSIRHAFEFVPVSSSRSSNSPPSTSLSDSVEDSPLHLHSHAGGGAQTFSGSDSSSKSLSSPITPTGAPIEINIRDSFIAAPGFTLVSFDYCQLELRIMAHFAKDENLAAQLRDPRVDMFNVVASQWLMKRVEDISGEERMQAKHICYAILYGQGTNALARTLKVCKADAKRFREDFNRRFAGLMEFTKNVIQETTATGYTETLAGRRRHFPQIYSRRNERGEREDYARAVRQITNTVCQGSAADIVKMATIQIEDMLRASAPLGRCIINLHDELVYELPTSMLHELIPRIQQIMQEVVTLTIPLPVRVFFGQTWGHLSPWFHPSTPSEPTIPL